MAEGHETQSSASEDLGPDDFYIGYMPEAPPRVASHARRFVGLVLVAVLGVAATLALAQRPFAVAFFDFGKPRAYEGILETWPHPVLRVERPGDATSAPTSIYYLVGFGKHGAEADVGDLVGRRIKLQGTPIYRDDQTMLEVVTGSVEEAEGGAVHKTDEPVSLGRHALVGEIVDSKCYLGVMKPGDRKAHRACATLCIRGGVPPVFVVRQGEASRYLLLVGEDGRALNQEIIDWIAEPMEITGEVVRTGDLWMLKAEPASFKSAV